MGDKTKIEWTDASWTPIRARYFESLGNEGGKERIGWHCEHVSDGCRNCYAEAMNRRLGTGFDFKPGHRKRQVIIGGARAGQDWRGQADGYSRGSRGDVELFLDETMLTAPLRWKRARRAFVCSMTDLFAEFVPDAWIDRMFAVMALAPQHTFQVLTKRAKRMREYLSDPSLQDRISRAMHIEHSRHYGHADPYGARGYVNLPLPNLLLGVSAEDQRRADERIPDLLATPAAVRFVSAEPLLGGIDFTNHDPTGIQKRMGAHGWSSIWRNNHIGRPWLDWIIVGGESGLGARPMDVTWARSIVAQCAAAGVACFVKQLGTDPVWEDGAFLNLSDRKGGDPSEWPEDLRVRQMPSMA